MINYAGTTRLALEMVKSHNGIAFLYDEAIKNEVDNNELKKYELLNFEPTQNFYAIYNRFSYLDNFINDLLDELKVTI